jgi:glucose/arabinose dehydrogenase
MVDGQRVGVGIVGALLVVGVVTAGGQGSTGQQAPDPTQQKYPYPVVRDLKGVIPPGPKPLPSPPLGSGPWTYQTTEAKIRVSVVTKGFSHPYGFTFLPDGTTIFISERAGALRVVRNDVIDPNPVAGVPKVIYRGTEAGLMDVVLHPGFEKNRWVYFTYHKPIGNNLASNAVGRGTWDGNALTDVKEIFLSDDVDTEVSRIAFGRDGMLYMTIGGPGTGPAPSLNRPQNGNDYAGKLLRMRDDGSLPPDNPYAGKSGYKPYIYAMGFRNQLGLTVNPYNGEVWAAEQGPNGGDEVNVILPGRNYGWPLASYGRDYLGPRFNAQHTAQGFEEPTVYWVPSIAVSGMTFYNGDRFPNWRRNLFVGGMREGEMSPTGKLERIVFNDKWQELRRESLLRDLQQRIRDVRQGPDGLLYVVTEEDDAACASSRSSNKRLSALGSRLWLVLSTPVLVLPRAQSPEPSPVSPRDTRFVPARCTGPGRLSRGSRAARAARRSASTTLRLLHPTRTLPACPARCARHRQSPASASRPRWRCSRTRSTRRSPCRP